MKKLICLCVLLNDYQLLFQAIDIGRGGNPRAAITWMGLLIKKDYVPPENLLKSSTLIILIEEGLAIGMAKDIVDKDPETIEAMFWLSDGTTWHSDVEKFEVHPHHYEGMESLALVFLIPPSESFKIQGLPINWTSSDSAPDSAIIVGFHQDLGIIRQTQIQVVICDKRRCDAFYTSRASQPYLMMPKYSCYNENQENLSFCDYRSGMALVYMTRTGHFNLFAIGVGDPGCNTCSRWIHFHPYREWIQYFSGPYLRSSRADQGMYDYYEDLDQELIVNLFKKDKKEVRWTWKGEWLSGACWLKKDNLVYREQMHYITWRNSSYGSYSLSMYDLIYKHITCATLWTSTNFRSKSRWWTTRGFQQDDIDHYVKKVPISIDGKISPKIVFLIDKWRKYHDADIRVTHVSFEFTFNLEVELEINFYAKK